MGPGFDGWLFSLSLALSSSAMQNTKNECAYVCVCVCVCFACGENDYILVNKRPRQMYFITSNLSSVQMHAYI